MTDATYCAIDFGTSNSAIAVPDGAARCGWSSSSPGFTTMPTAVFYPGDGGARRGPPRARIRPGRRRGLCRRPRRPPDALDEEHPRQRLVEQTTDVGGGRGGALPRRRRRPTCATCAPRRGGGRRPIERAVLGRPVFFVDDDPARDAQAESALRRGRARAPAFARSSSSTSRSPPPSTTSSGVTASRRSWSPTSAAAPPTSRSCASGPARRGAASTARTTSSPTTACTSPAPTSTGASSCRACCRCSATAPRAGGRRLAGARGAERGLLRPRDLAPDQHRLQPAARRRAARHALVLRRPGAPPAADDGRHRALRPRPRRARRGGEDRGRVGRRGRR